ncbi:MAG: FecR domain-containing protein [Spirochaetaceae bacterium]|nr:FecR domain-containing protein [Spirochaetaceae bacterium]
MHKRPAIGFALLMAGSLAFAAPTAILSGLKGKVEVKPASGDWRPATEGMRLELSATISTGFDSTANLLIEKSKILVKPLTRLTLDKLVEQQPGSLSTSVYLRVGAVQASVKAATPGTPQDFKVQSPYSTASVRGTEFEFDGIRLVVIEGKVRFIPGPPRREGQEGGQSGDQGGQGGQAGDQGDGDQGVDVDAGEAAELEQNYSMDLGGDGVSQDGEGETGDDGLGDLGDEDGGGSEGAGFGTVIITINPEPIPQLPQ